MKIVQLMLIVILVMTGSALAEEPTKIEISGGDELVKEKGRFQETWIHPDADITRYDKVYPWAPVFQFRDVGEERTVVSQSQMLSGQYGSSTIDEESRLEFEKIVIEAMVTELGRSKKFKLVNKIKPGTLLVRGLWLDIVSSVPPRTAGTYDIHLSSVGEATFVFELIDAETGVMLARVAERRVIQPPSRMNQVSSTPSNSATIWNDVKIWAADVARDVRTALDKAKKKAEKKK